MTIGNRKDCETQRSSGAKAEIGVNRYDSAKKDRFARNTAGSPKNEEKIHDLQLKTEQNMFGIAQRTR